MKEALKYLTLSFVLLLGACRKDPPPSIEVCIISDGGSADCVKADGTKVFRLPSEMVNYWATSQTDMKNFSSWCYSTSKANVKANMEKLELAIKGN